MNYLDPGEESEGNPRPQAVHWRAGDQAGQPEGESDLQISKYQWPCSYTSYFLVPGQAGAAENSGGAPAPTARGPEATTAAAERRQTTAGQVSARGCDNDKPDSEMRPEIKHQHHGTDERLNLL